MDVKEGIRILNSLGKMLLESLNEFYLFYQKWEQAFQKKDEDFIRTKLTVMEGIGYYTYRSIKRGAFKPFSLWKEDFCISQKTYNAMRDNMLLEFLRKFEKNYNCLPEEEKNEIFRLCKEKVDNISSIINYE